MEQIPQTPYRHQLEILTTFTSTLPVTETVQLVEGLTGDQPQELASPHPPWNDENMKTFISFEMITIVKSEKLMIIQTINK